MCVLNYESGDNFVNTNVAHLKSLHFNQFSNNNCCHTHCRYVLCFFFHALGLLI